jgi:hypothetical protein
MSQISIATVDQYLTQVSEDASTTSQCFRKSRPKGPEALATPDTSSDIYSDAANTPECFEERDVQGYHCSLAWRFCERDDGRRGSGWRSRGQPK